MERWLYLIMLVKTAHKDFPQELPSQNNLQRGEWNAVTAEIDDVELQTCHFLDLQLKNCLSICSTTVPDHPRKTKHHGLVPCPQVAETYLKSINIHNHVWTGSSALQDVWKTLNPDRCQLAGILDFCLTNAFLPIHHFQNPKLEHYKFKISASNSLTAFKSNSLCQTRKLEVSTEMPLHPLEKLEYTLVFIASMVLTNQALAIILPLSDVGSARCHFVGLLKEIFGIFTY